ncbi:hypothetical protein [Halalkalibacterium halodurans]|jgi:hypothetical protein|nr:hypothetical protein [Halalkalibacterium halodurans]MDY7221157.1 hypothetical protein [Halalkalibacterium halodurans]MDY7240396.1 hypothetical protein [Halalkalibacterium halodurans]MED4125362.1 hypothetical protein [Halalkalibacterium halodurans]MED4172500.1 hypothetical protein [Halalkalibacterium halodurans]
MKNAILTLIAASFIFGFITPQDLNSTTSPDSGFSILEKTTVGGT